VTAHVSPGRPAWGFGLATYDAGGELLDVWFPDPQLGEAPEEDYHAPASLCALEGHDPVREVNRLVLHLAVADLDAPPADRADVWLRLHLL
jgi:2,3,4,5-tetrahydropyridine-2-carboxylate N-succinyltransferase